MRTAVRSTDVGRFRKRRDPITRPHQSDRCDSHLVRNGGFRFITDTQPCSTRRSKRQDQRKVEEVRPSGSCSGVTDKQECERRSRADWMTARGEKGVGARNTVAAARAAPGIVRAELAVAPRQRIDVLRKNASVAARFRNKPSGPPYLARPAQILLLVVNRIVGGLTNSCGGGVAKPPFDAFEKSATGPFDQHNGSAPSWQRRRPARLRSRIREATL